MGATPEPRRRWRNRLWDLVVDMYREISDDGVFDLAAGVTFWTVFAIPPSILAFTAFLGLLRPIFGDELRDDLRDRTVDFVGDEIGGDEQLLDAVAGLFDERGAGLFVFSLALALWSVSRGFAGLVRALDRAYDLDDDRSWFSVRATALVMALGTVVTGAVVLALFVVGPLLGQGEAIADLVGLGDVFATLWDLARGPALFLVLIAWAATLFHVGPDHRTPWRWDLPGAALTGTLWLLLSQSFGLYVRFAGGSVTGVIGTGLVALSWIWLMSIALLVGAELNAILAARAGVAQKPRDRVDELVDTVRLRVTRRLTGGPASTSAADPGLHGGHDLVVADPAEEADQPVVAGSDHEARAEHLVGRHDDGPVGGGPQLGHGRADREA